MPIENALIIGQWYSGKTSQKCNALLRVNSDGLVIIANASTKEELLRLSFTDITISSRLGNTPRYLKCPAGSVFETSENIAIDALEQKWNPSSFTGLLHTLESHLSMVVVAVVFMVVFVWGMMQHGIPLSAKYIAETLPQDTLKTLASETMLMLDKTQFEPSELTATEQKELQNTFSQALAQYKELHVNVIFRHGGETIGANAFALPDGTIVFTDEIIALADNNNQLISVLAHEIGHVEKRHSLRSVIENSALGFGFVMLVGDASAVGEMLLSLPVILTTLSYSRTHETEADVFSGKFLDANNINRQAFVNIMTHLQENAECNALIDLYTDDADDASTKTAKQALTVPERAELCGKLREEHEDDDEKDGSSDRWQDYFSTHPGMNERLQDFVRH